ncbi:MAG: Uma2 family endonuclease [Planctomycetota bacterium]|nr:Uma2 family endonuclease [Planctomycetota bacterium]
MSVTTQPTWQASQIPPFPVRRFTVDEYHRMAQAGVLTENDPVELLEGWIVAKMPHKPSHDATIDQTDEILRGQLPTGWRIRIQSAITTDDSEPEPDLAVVLGPASRYATHHPGPQDIALLIEVADSSLAHDRDVKGRLYARAGIAAYWIINLVDMQIEVYNEPSGPTANPGYRQHHTYRAGELLPLVIVRQSVAVIAVRDLLV